MGSVDLHLSPWQTVNDYLQVGESLVRASDLPNNDQSSLLPPHGGHDDSSLEDAVRRVAVWRIRAGSQGLPHCLESTATLAEVLLHDVHCTRFSPRSNAGGSASLSSYSQSLRLAYSSAVVRGVNAIADALMPRRGVLPKIMSVASLCRKIGMPIFLVNLRHDISHGTLPSLPSLRMAARVLLAFLGTAYWQPLTESRQLLEASTREKATMFISTWATKKKRKRQDSASDNGNESTVKTKKRQRDISSEEEIKGHLNSIPLDIGPWSIVSFLIHGIDINSFEEKSNLRIGAGALVPDDALAFPATKAGFKKYCSQMIKQLLTLQERWANFVRMLVFELVEAIFLLVHSPVRTTTFQSSIKRQFFFLSSWLKYFISDREWENLVAHTRIKNTSHALDKTEAAEANGSKSDAFFNCIPLNCLCERLEDELTYFLPSHWAYETLLLLRHNLLNAITSYHHRHPLNECTALETLEVSENFEANSCMSLDQMEKKVLHRGTEGNRQSVNNLTQEVIDFQPHTRQLQPGGIDTKTEERRILPISYLETFTKQMVRRKKSKDASNGFGGHGELTEKANGGRWSLCTSWDFAPIGSFPTSSE